MRDITIVEVSPRDGLQNESEILSTDAKVDLITRLVDAGARRVEAVYVLERMGHRTGIDLATLLPTAEFLGAQLGHEVPALPPRAGVFP